MIIIEKPYVSEFLIDSIVQNDWVVLENEALDIAGIEDGAFETIDFETASEYYNQVEYPIIYSNSENSINWVLENLPESNLSRYIKLFKDKVEFRKMLKDVYPDFYFQEINYDDLSKLPLEELKYPFVLKPAVGFLSLGVHTVHNDEDWKQTLVQLEYEMELAQKFYPEAVVNSSKFILEEYIQGEEYAVDAYYDKNGNPVILNIFQHPFFDSKDVSDRIYIMSAEIMVKYMAKFALLLKEIGDKNDIRNFPLHIELRVTEDERIIPIEVNPMRFAGWCTTDVSKYAWGINVYECFMGQKTPDWNDILSKASKEIFYFSMAEVPSSIDREKIKDFEYDTWLANYSNVLDVRRINPKKHPLFAVIFGSTENKDEINKILQLKTKDYTIFV
ncbi:MAG: ATP-grasp domain-containing protein [Candidatus Gastranaerophilales bacterium]|nr:ATP-grasp domain-containing protein [Candidatus Gastranaerophilales bacterium]